MVFCRPGLCGGHRVGRWHIHGWVLGKEVSRPQKQRNWLGRHHREVLGCRNVRNSKNMETQDIRVVNVILTVSIPLPESNHAVSGPLRNKVSRWIQPVLLVWDDLKGVVGPGCPLVRQGSRLCKHRRALERH